LLNDKQNFYQIRSNWGSTIQFLEFKIMNVTKFHPIITSRNNCPHVFISEISLDHVQCPQSLAQKLQESGKHRYVAPNATNFTLILKLEANVDSRITDHA